MSCFIGSFRALPGVRCDRFDSIKGEGNTVAADQFFLSHCHSDHMVGMETLNIFMRKKSRGTRINHHLYCSVISKAFILRKYKNFPANTIITLIPNDPKIVTVYDSLNVYFLKVTALPSNHCPGSLMFMFERLDDKEGPVEKRILYTGDFRFDDLLVPLTALRSLHDSNTKPLVIDEMYLDTTFCSSQYLTFPTRQESEEKIWELCQKWIRKNGMFKDTRSKHVILFNLSARYGYESIMQTVFTRSRAQWRVHVDGSNFGDYLCSSSLAECTDPDPKNAPWIHACKEGKRHHLKRNHNEPMLKSLPCQAGDFEVCQIKPCAMYFKQEKMRQLEEAGHDRVVSVSQGGSNYRVCYSTHSSLVELERFVRHFAPLQITPCVIPLTNPPTTKEDVGATIASWLEPTPSTLSPSLSPPLLMSPSVPGVPTTTVTNLTSQDKYDPDVMMSPSPPANSLKRKMSSFDGGDTSQSSLSSPQPKLLKLEACDSSKKISFDDTMEVEEKVMEGEPDSSDDEAEEFQNRYHVEIVPSNQPSDLPPLPSPFHTTTITSKVDRRRMFARSKSGKACYSMPVPFEPEQKYIVPKERRKSMPSNMKMPIIKVTPSSPSPDPNHPDYPEFFEDKLYLELTNGSTKNKNFPSVPLDFNKEVSIDNLSLMLEPDDDDVMMVDSTTELKTGPSPLKMRRQNSLFMNSVDQGDKKEVYSSRHPDQFSNCDSSSVDVVSSSTKQNLCLESISDVQESSQQLQESDQEVLNDTPEIEDLIEDAENNDLPEYVMESLLETQRKKDNIVTID